jgi:hypothetical protein
MAQDPKEMLDQYRATTTPQFAPLIEGFKKMSLAERDELLFFVSMFMAQQYTALLREYQALQDTFRRLGIGGDPGKPN